MAIQGTFLADFVAFEGATKSATATLQTFEATGATVNTRLKNLSAVSASGAVSAQAVTGEYRQFDSVLRLLGVNIGKEGKALGELGDASGKTSAQLGKVATAGFVVAAAMGGWKVGRAIADFFDLDAAIGTATAKLLGFGDVAGQVAGAQLDSINKAIRDGAPAWVSYTAAMAFNTGTAEKAAKVAQDLDDILTRGKGPAASAQQLALWRAELALITEGGVLDGLTADLDSQNFSLEQLSERYKISIPALQLFSRENKAAAADYAAQRAGLQKLEDQWAASTAKQAAALKAAADTLAGATERIAFDTQTLAAQLATIDPILAAEATALLEAGAAAADVAIKTGLAAREVQALEEAMAGGTGAAYGYADSLRDVAAAKAADAKANDAAMAEISGRYGPQITYGPGGLAGGGEGYLGESAADIARRQGNRNQSFTTDRPGGGGSAVTGPRTGGGGLMTVTINVNGTAADIARQIEEQLVKSAKLRGQLGGGTA